MLKRFVPLLFLFLSSVSLFGQDPQFTQFYANPLYLNPAFAGSVRCPRFVMNYRNQWPAIPGNFVTYSASYDQHFDALGGGIGVLVNNDQAGEGTLITTNVSGIYSYHLPVSRKFSIKAGFQATYSQRTLDWTRLTFGDQIDSRYGFIYNTKETFGPNNVSFVDFSVGVIGYSEKFFIGFAAHHLTQPDQSFLVPTSRLPMKLTGHMGAVINLGRKTRFNDPAKISPNILFQQQQDFRQINLGMYFQKSPFIAGLWYRNKDAFIILAGLQQGLFKFGYSYDVTISRLTNATAGAHEISFAMQLACKPVKKRFRTINCPSF
ncbi:MAG: type IX secretion system membrane protein PorP/SprF [Bacteroidia bacterium]|nr:type IX secretion system membrane protein PorP/SprF [Bacteroidia bacterium]MCC6768972.1 type IX secretion system membrane protein PorP/SprF [Bacteroidia bacterium]